MFTPRSDNTTDIDTRKQSAFSASMMLSTTRFMLTPAIGYMLLNEMHDEALLCFTVAALTDLVEKMIPDRSHIEVSMDSVADKALTVTCFITLFNLDIITIYFIKAFIARDLAILICSVMIRYLGLSGNADKPTIKKFINMKKYPTLGLEPLTSSKFHVAMQYITIGTLIATSHTLGSDFQYWLMIFLGCCTGITNSSSLVYLYMRMSTFADRFTTTKLARLRR